jgi:hypothetical protein
VLRGAQTRSLHTSICSPKLEHFADLAARLAARERTTGGLNERDWPNGAALTCAALRDALRTLTDIAALGFRMPSKGGPGHAFGM